MSEAPLRQLELFAHVAAAYADAARLGNETLYAEVVARAGLDASCLDERVPIGASGQRHSVLKRQIRWHQQSLKHAGVLQRAPGQRGVWELIERTDTGLHGAPRAVRLVAFSTTLGVAVWGDCTEVMSRIDEPVHLVVTSPPFALRKPRAYGAPDGACYADFIVEALAPLVRNLVPGGSVCLELCSDTFEPGLPSRTLDCERVLLALCDRLGLHLMDRLIWSNPSRPPGPVQWASIRRVQLNTGFSPIYWLTNDPARVRSDNRRVLEPHTERHLATIRRGGEARDGVYADGAYRIHPGRFGTLTPGRIPKNVLERGARCADTLQVRRDARALGLPTHGAVMPISVPDFLIRFLSEPEDLVVDPFGGTVKTGRAAERLGRRWLVTERILDYLRASAERFRDCEGFHIPDAIEAWPRKAA